MALTAWHKACIWSIPHCTPAVIQSLLQKIKYVVIVLGLYSEMKMWVSDGVGDTRMCLYLSMTVLGGDGMYIKWSMSHELDMFVAGVWYE